MALPIQSVGAPLNVAHALARAVELYKQGQLSDAERLYSAILAAEPGQSVRKRPGRLSAEADRRAVCTAAPSPQVLLNHGLALNVLNALNHRVDALASFDREIALQSNFSKECINLPSRFSWRWRYRRQDRPATQRAGVWQ
jgi:hypothetical protein